MEKARNDLNLDARTYFLNQGQAIGKLNGILYTHTFTMHLGKWFSVFFEVLFYLLFVTIIAALIIIPSDPRILFNIGDEMAIEMIISIDQLTAFITFVKIVIAILSIPLLTFAVLLGRLRRKNTIISKAFDETIKMKEAFDMAVKELNL